MLERVEINKLYLYQRDLLFLVVLLFPIQTILVYQKSLFSTFSFYGQISSIPLLVGYVLAVVTCVREHQVKNLLFPVFTIAAFYVLLCAGISFHSIFEYSNIGPFDATTFGETSKTRLLKNLLVTLGVSSDAILYGLIVLMRDTMNSVREVVFAFGTVVWIAFLSRKDFLGTFETVRKAVLWSTAFLTPYIACELMHLYGMGGATSVLKAINSGLYEPSAFLGYPPIVSPNQIRGTWTEPAYFAIWLVFAVPFLISHFFKDGSLSFKRLVRNALFFTIIFSIWFMTYARTSVVLMTVLVGLNLFFAVIFCTRENWEKASILCISVLAAFFITSAWGPQDVSRRVSIKATDATSSVVQKESISQSSDNLLGINRQKKASTGDKLTVNKEPLRASESTLFKNTVKSTVDSKSRSNPARLEDFFSKLEVFKEFPLMGAGDTLSSVAQLHKLLERRSQLTSESQQRIAETQSKGIFQSPLGGCSLSVSGTLCARGLIGFLISFLPILFLGLLLFVQILKVTGFPRECGITIFISSVGSFLSSFSQGLYFFYFWCSAGLALSLLFWLRVGNSDGKIPMNLQ